MLPANPKQSPTSSQHIMHLLFKRCQSKPECVPYSLRVEFYAAFPSSNCHGARARTDGRAPFDGDDLSRPGGTD